MIPTTVCGTRPMSTVISARPCNGGTRSMRKVEAVTSAPVTGSPDSS